MASAGQINAESVEVFGLPAGEYGSLDADTNPILSYDEADKEPSHIVSNSPASGTDKAVTLGNDTKIAGDVKAAGEIDPGSAVIQGNLLPGSTEQNLPDITVEGFDPAGESDTYAWTGAIPTGATAPVLVGRSRYDGNLTINNLDMAEGLLYVDGDVTITGTVKGKGAIVATGKITVTGSMNTNADHAALVAKGDIKIHGNGPNSSKFQGLVYSEGSIDIAKTQIIGAAVSKKSTGTTKLEDVRAISVPELTKIDFEVHATLEEAKKTATDATRGRSPYPIGIGQADGTYTQLAPNGNSSALKALAQTLKDVEEGENTWQMVKKTGPNSYNPELIGDDAQSDNAKKLWDKYLGEVASPQGPETLGVFSLDLNTLVSLDVKLEMMYHTTSTKK